MIAGGLPADKKVGELKRDISLRDFLFKSISWLELIISNNLQDPNELLIKQIIVAHLKLAQGSLTSGDLQELRDFPVFLVKYVFDFEWHQKSPLKLDGIFGGCTDQQLKTEASSQLLFLVANLAECDTGRRNVLLLQSLCYEQGVYRSVNQECVFFNFPMPIVKIFKSTGKMKNQKW